MKPPKTLGYVPPKGAAWNPLLRFPPNEKCFCGKAKKAKKCCLPKINRCVPEEVAKEYERFIRYIESGATFEVKP